MQNIKISPSILSADFACLGDEVIKLCEAGADYIHIDVMDGHFVPNITIGSAVIESIKQVSTVPLDVHLMIENVESYAQQFIKAGADILTFHLESAQANLQLINYIRSLGKVRIGIAISPSTPATILRDIIHEVDLVLVMTVEPGFAKQKFMHSQVKKIAAVKSLIEHTGRKIDLAVDGGINEETAKLCVKAGANVLVASSYIFSSKKIGYQERILKLRETS
jgi:ribulose-phosphate 3-epimerase